MAESKDKPKHRMVIAPSLSALENRLAELVMATKGEDALAPVVVLVGSNLLRNYLRRRLGGILNGHINLRFPLIIDLVSALSAPRRQKQEGRSAPYSGQELLASLIAREESGYFSAIQDKAGFHRLLVAAFTDMREGGIDDLEKLLSSLPKDLRPASQDKLSSLGNLYRRYRQLYNQLKYLDSADIFGMAIDGAGGFSSVFEGGNNLIVYNIYDLNFVQEQLFSALAEHISLTFLLFCRDNPGFKYCQKILDFCSALGAEKTVVDDSEDLAPDHLSRLHRHLFSDQMIPESELLENDQTISILSCPHPQAEGEEIARQVLSLASAGMPFYQMAVLTRTREYSRMVGKVFARAGIPFHLAGGVVFAETRLGRSLLLLLEAWGKDLSRHQVMDFLTYAPLNQSLLDNLIPNISLWNALSLSAGVVEGADDWENCLNGLAGHYQDLVGHRREDEEEESPDRETEAQLGLMKKVVKKLIKELSQIPAQTTWQNLTAAFESLAVHFIADEQSIADDSSSGFALSDIIDNIHNLTRLAEISPEVDIDTFKRLVKELLAGYSKKVGRFQQSGVNILNLMPARSARFRVVFVPGMVDGLFPARPGKDPLLLDREREAINQTLANSGNPGKLPIKAWRTDEEKLLLRTAVESAGEKLIFTYPRQEGEAGRLRLPSYFLLAVGQALCGELLSYAELESFPVVKRIPLSAAIPSSKEKILDEEEYDIVNVLSYLEDRKPEHFAYLLRPSSVGLGSISPALRAETERRAKTFGRYDAILQSEEARDVLRQVLGPVEGPYSPSTLEKYATCPYQYYLEKVMKLNILPEPEKIMEISNLDLGRLYHQILEEFVRWTIEESKLPMVAEEMALHHQRMQEIASAHFADYEKMGLSGYPLVWELQTEFIRQDLSLFVEEESYQERERGYIPQRVELRFGYGKTPEEQVAVDIGNGRVIFLKGRIDRLDLKEGKEKDFRITDYKSGKDGKITEKRLFDGGRQLQLPLYMLAAASLLKTAMDKGYARYLYVAREKVKNNFEELLESGILLENEGLLKEIVGKIIFGMESGLFFAVPEGGIGGYCSYCDYSQICTPAYRSLAEVKQAGALIKDFLDMRAVT